MINQSCDHILLVEPESFFSNPETMETNPYQAQNPENLKEINQKAIAEHRAYRDAIINAGIAVTCMKGKKGTPDDIFGGNCYSTHADGTAYIYSMMAENRRQEKRPYMTDIITRGYETIIDYSALEQDNRFLEGTGSMVMDHVNRVVYATLSKRTNEDLVKQWCKEQGYEPVIFHCTDPYGKSVYHTDLVLYIGTEVAGFVSGCVDEEFKKPVLDRLSKTHDVVEFDKDQLLKMVGNSLEVRNFDNDRYLIMSDTAYKGMRDDQRTRLEPYFKDIIHPDISTIEEYGGGSARCLILEMF